MRNVEFIAQLTSNTNKTTHIRTYAGKWTTGASRVPDKVATRIGKIISLVQQKVNEGVLCNPKEECLLVYNFQPCAVLEDTMFISLEMLVKPISDIHKADVLGGKPIQVTVDGSDGRVMNATQSLLDMGLLSHTEIEEEAIDPPIVYGNYNDYECVSCFIAIACRKPIKDLMVFFNGSMDNEPMVKKAVAFDSFVEARNYLADQPLLGRYVGEITCSKQDAAGAIAKGISKNLIKVLDYFDPKVEIAPDPDIIKREDRIEDERHLIIQTMQ